MLIIAAAIIFVLRGFHVLDDSAEIEWLFIGLALFALHFIVPLAPVYDRFRR